jgi:hypothetical protein
MVGVVVLWEIHHLGFLKKEQMQFIASSPCQPNTGKSISTLQGKKFMLYIIYLFQEFFCEYTVFLNPKI